MATVKTLIVVIAACIVASIAFAAVAWRPSIDPITPPAAKSFEPGLVKRGAELAAVGGCNTCHTAPGGRAFAGGRGLPTPFGTIYATNITPDAETGIGRWSREAFRRAMREGVDRLGRHLYPVFPYDHFTLATDEDVSALYAYFMTRESVRATTPANDIAFPLNLRPLIAGWKLLYLRLGPYRPDPAQSQEWNRGAYLVEGLAHCGACHTPRNALGAEKQQDRFGGGQAEGFTAYALNRASPAPVRWDVAAVDLYLRNGWHEAHGIAFGPMAPVIDNLDPISARDLHAISAYLAGIIGESGAVGRQASPAVGEGVRTPGPASRPAADVEFGDATASGAKIYQGACAHCHAGGRPLPFGGIDLALSTGPSAPNPRNVISVVLWGLPPTEGERSPMMPGFAGSLNDQQLAALLSYVRSRFSDKPVWIDIATEIRNARAGRRLPMYPTHGTDPAQAIASQRESQR
jgi:mono/diheme cytochrome c family protein